MCTVSGEGIVTSEICVLNSCNFVIFLMWPMLWQFHPQGNGLFTMLKAHFVGVNCLLCFLSVFIVFCVCKL